MFNKKMIFVFALLAAALTSGCTNGADFGDMSVSPPVGGSFAVSGSDSTGGGDPDSDSSVDTPPETEPNAQTDWEELFRETVTVTADQLADIPAGTSYGGILEKLGNTQAFGQPKYRQYVTDDGRVIRLWFESKEELCPYSGVELYERAVPLNYDGEIPEGMLYGVITGDGSFFTYYETLGTDSIVLTGEYLLTKDAEIVFGDGTPASADDIKPEIPALVEYDFVFQMYPGQMHCTKIILLK